MKECTKTDCKKYNVNYCSNCSLDNLTDLLECKERKKQEQIDKLVAEGKFVVECNCSEIIAADNEYDSELAYDRHCDEKHS